jgi:hypothetical protein
MELATLANIAEIFGAIVVIGGVIFAVAQLALFRRQRRETTAIELARSIQSPEFAHALQQVLSLPSGLSAAKLRQKGPEVEEAAMLVSLTFESVGIMVHRRVVPLKMVWELMGGVVLAAWERLEGWVMDVRQEHGREKFDEWIQWLCDQLDRYCVEGDDAPAFDRYRDWRPKAD